MKQKAFTIMESIITLALISIIISMVYLVFIYFSKNVSDYTLMTSQKFDLNLFSLKLKEDFFTSDIIITENGKDFIIEFYDESRVYYYQRQNFLIRESIYDKDSLPLKSIQMNFLNESTNNEISNIITNLDIETTLDKKVIDLYFHKTYFTNYLNPMQ